RLEDLRALLTQELLALLRAKPQDDVVTMHAYEHVPLHKAGRKPEHLLMLHIRIPWSDLIKGRQQFGRRFWHVHFYKAPDLWAALPQGRTRPRWAAIMGPPIRCA